MKPVSYFHLKPRSRGPAVDRQNVLAVVIQETWTGFWLPGRRGLDILVDWLKRSSSTYNLSDKRSNHKYPSKKFWFVNYSNYWASSTVSNTVDWVPWRTCAYVWLVWVTLSGYLGQGGAWRLKPMGSSYFLSSIPPTLRKPTGFEGPRHHDL